MATAWGRGSRRQVVGGLVLLVWAGGVIVHERRCQAGPVFTNVTASAGIHHVQKAVPLEDDIIGFMAGGAAAGDFDGDGWIDVYVTRYDNSDILYRNNGNGTFTDVTVSAFGANHLKNAKTDGVGWADINNDGHLDLYVTAHDSINHYLYMNNGDGTFSEQGMARNAVTYGPRNHFGKGIAFGDVNLDGYLDIYVAEWGFHPGGVMTNNRLLLNRGSEAPGYFTDITISAGVVVDIADPGATIGYGFAPRFADLDGDGWPDLAVGSDFRTSKIFWNNGDWEGASGTFTDGTAAAGVGLGWNDMGSTIGDFNGDGKLDWFTSDIADTFGNYLYQNNGDRTFTDVSDAQNIRDGGFGWGASFLDFNNDGDLDLVQTNGYQQPWTSDQTRFWENINGQYVQRATQVGITDTGQGRGLLVFDFDNDGDLDIFIVNNAAAPILYRNDGGNQNNWLRIETEGTESNRMGIGAFITVIPDLEAEMNEALGVIQGSMFHEVSASSNYLGQNEVIAHFGLGDHEMVDLVSIRWPSGQVQNFFNVDANQLFHALEGAYSVFVGDMNGDGALDAFDVSAFELALADSESYMQLYPGIDPALAGDVDGSGVFDAFDVSIFESRLARGAIPMAMSVPEPGTLLLLGLTGLAAGGRRRKR